MKNSPALIRLGALLTMTATVNAAFHGPVFYGDPPDDHHPWAVHDANRPQPILVKPGTFSSQEQPGRPPSDAIILFDGTDLSKWEADTGEGAPTKWIINQGAMECAPGSGFIRTREKFGDCQLHIEWAAPTKIQGESQGRGNSGVFMMGLVEIQVLDNYENPTYADGAAASVYGVNPPMANALRPPGEFQVYDIVFRRPIYRNRELVEPGYVTVFENGVLVQDHTRLEGVNGHMARSKPGPFPDTGPLKLQDHGNPVRFRNIWYRPLPPTPAEGGTDGYLTTEAALAKRKDIASSLRESAAKLKDSSNSVPEMLRLAESLEYNRDEEAFKSFKLMAEQYVAALKQLPAEQLTAKKDEGKQVQAALRYLTKFKIISADFEPKVQLDQIAKDQNWAKK